MTYSGKFSTRIDYMRELVRVNRETVLLCTLYLTLNISGGQSPCSALTQKGTGRTDVFLPSTACLSTKKLQITRNYDVRRYPTFIPTKIGIVNQMEYAMFFIKKSVCMSINT